MSSIFVVSKLKRFIFEKKKLNFKKNEKINLNQRNYWSKLNMFKINQASSCGLSILSAELPTEILSRTDEP